MTLVEVQNVGNSFITIRGISQARNSEPSVAVLVDGVLEPNPYEFDQELTDIKQIEVLKGPQGALVRPQRHRRRDHHPHRRSLRSLRGHRQGSASATACPRRRSWPSADRSIRPERSKYRASLNFYNTDGYLENTYLDRKADPYRDYSGRLRLLWKPSDDWTADLRVFRDHVETTAYYYIIPRDDEANPFSSFTTPPNANDVTSPIQNNNLGSDNRDVTISRSSSTTAWDWARSRRSRTTTTPRRSTPVTPTTSGRSTRPSPITALLRAVSRLPWAGRSMRARASSST